MLDEIEADARSVLTQHGIEPHAPRQDSQELRLHLASVRDAMRRKKVAQAINDTRAIRKEDAAIKKAISV